MNKFTIFTIIFSAIVVITVGELVVNDYLDRHGESADSEEQMPDVDVEVGVVEDAVVEEAIVEQVSIYLAAFDYISFGFAEGTELREKDFTGSIFQFLSFDDDSVERHYYELFEGESYVGGLYEINCSDPTEAFTVYTDLKQDGLGQPKNGTINEVNNYGEASFYFNDNVKTTSVFLVVLKGDRVYAFSYGHSHHEKFKGVFDAL